MLLDLWLMLGVCSLSVLGSCMSHCSFLFLFMVVRVILKKEERSRIRAVQMDNLKGVLSIRRMDKVPYAQIKELRNGEVCGLRVDEGVLRRLDHVERMEKDRIIKKVYVGVCW